jgi:geranylgeranyl pyrophosphate synthase
LPTRKEAILATFAEAVGVEGVLGGQVKDIEGEGADISEAGLRQIHRLKTASLISASLVMGGHLAGGAGERLLLLRRFGRDLGLLFQLVDDLLNVEGSAAVLGRPTGSDERLRKATYPRVLGVEGARLRMRRRVASVRRMAREFGSWSVLFDDLVTTVASRVPSSKEKEVT